jgi:hypothetical protein
MLRIEHKTVSSQSVEKAFNWRNSQCETESFDVSEDGMGYRLLRTQGVLTMKLFFRLLRNIELNRKITLNFTGIFNPVSAIPFCFI